MSGTKLAFYIELTFYIVLTHHLQSLTWVRHDFYVMNAIRCMHPRAIWLWSASILFERLCKQVRS